MAYPDGMQCDSTNDKRRDWASAQSLRFFIMEMASVRDVRDQKPEDRLRLALAMNMDLADRKRAFERVFALVPQVPANERDLVVAALLALGEKGLSEAEQKRLREELRQVSKMAQDLYRRQGGRPYRNGQGDAGGWRRRRADHALYGALARTNRRTAQADPPRYWA